MNGQMDTVYLNTVRLRRLRRNEAIRELVAEERLSKSSLVQPIFVRHGEKIEEDIEAMPGIKRYSIDTLEKYVEGLKEKGINAILLFGIPKKKDELGTEAYSKEGIIPMAIRRLKEVFNNLVVIADVCLCEYTSHGHCGVIENGYVSNDKTLPLLSKAALVYAEAGADIVAPSAMMDHQVFAIRKELDLNGYNDTLIMSYSSKFASSLYSPFREAAYSAPKFGSRKEYQLDYRNKKQAIREIELDIEEGADIVMVKPALPYLDIVQIASSIFNVPIAAYFVSGEYCMVKAAAKMGYIDEDKTILELHNSIRRAGASIIISYYASRLADLI